MEDRSFITLSVLHRSVKLVRRLCPACIQECPTIWTILKALFGDECGRVDYVVNEKQKQENSFFA